LLEAATIATFPFKFNCIFSPESFGLSLVIEVTFNRLEAFLRCKMFNQKFHDESYRLFRKNRL